ncbi:condensation domain-containing protein (plasmid) [Streptomyces sp. NBC_00190]|uniref:condensation domain-containing protein n=1 Tax=Streptomyces sp. NBC_00190 TaxID=2903634 RepID=UPI002E2B5B63|nr:condensation domain-containing protein [Streptomyces sp. NBC_00190]
MSAAMAVVLVPGPPPSLELHGPLEAAHLEAALALLPACEPTLERHSDTHHTLTVAPHPYPVGLLSDLLSAAPARPRPRPRTRSTGPASRPRAADCGRGPRPPAVPASPLQRDLLLDTLVRPGAGLHVEQLLARWYGPLDLPRFTAAWRTLYDGDAALRTALADSAGAPPSMVVHPRVDPRIEHHGAGGADWHSLVLRERLREFDLRDPGQLRIVLLDEDAPPGSGSPSGPTRILFTYHRAFLDERSVRGLLRAFLRAYLADGRPLGGERRPDVRDHAHWLARQDTSAAREFWWRAAPPPDAVTLPAVRSDDQGTRAGEAQEGPGHGRNRARLTPLEAARLRAWAAAQGATESTALHAVWALLLYRAAARARRPDPVAVAFSVAVSGRGITLAGAELLSGALGNSLPLDVAVRAHMPVALLLDTLSGYALDRAAYEWVSAGQIEDWTGRRGTAAAPFESLVVFEPQAAAAHTGWGSSGTGPGRDAVVDELAEAGVQLDPPEVLAAHTALPFTLFAHHDTSGGLVLTSVHDRARFQDADAAGLLSQAALLLRTLPDGRGALDVSGALELLDGIPVPRVRPRPAAAARVLRAAARPGAGTICLLPAPGSPPGCYDGLPEFYDGPQALVTLPAGDDPALYLQALRPALARGEPVWLGGASGAGDAAWRAAERIAAHGWQPPLVAVAGAADGGTGLLRSLARALTAAARRPRLGTV